MVIKRDSIWKSVDWLTIAIYLALIIFGWFSVCGASYDYGKTDFFSFASRSGKQMTWIFCSFGLGFILLMLEEKFYDLLSYFIYVMMIVLLILTIFVAPDTKGSRSWLVFGPVSLQPAEFAKFATALAIAKFMNVYEFDIHKWKHLVAVCVIFLLPMTLIILQRETGSALVYMAFFLVLYREGMPGSILFAGVSAVIYFIVGMRYESVLMNDGMTSVGEFAVLYMALIFSAGMVYVYCKKMEHVINILLVGMGVSLCSYLFSRYIIPFNVNWVMIMLCVSLAVYLVYLAIVERNKIYAFIAIFIVSSMAFFYSTDYVFNNVMEPHQQVRIKVVLGMEDDLTGAGYNVNQSKIAIGSGGLYGKGFLNGTQTKLKYVPEQDTDFIFCTVGEEEGFLGSVTVLILFTVLIIRLIYLAERQDTRFGRVYGYSVLSIFLFHLFINIGMVLGLTPVIGIPLPFFSYGGSSLWGFTLLLFIFLRIDASRRIQS